MRCEAITSTTLPRGVSEINMAPISAHHPYLKYDSLGTNLGQVSNHPITSCNLIYPKFMLNVIPTCQSTYLHGDSSIQHSRNAYFGPL